MKVNWDDHSEYMEKKQVSNHQPVGINDIQKQSISSQSKEIFGTSSRYLLVISYIARPGKSPCYFMGIWEKPL